MPEFQNLQEAKDKINQLFKAKSGTAVDQTYLDDYAKIAWNLSNTAQFETALGRLSERLWDLYREYNARFGGHQRNLLTTALRELASNYGWKFGADTDVLLVGGVSAAQYETWTRQGQFFKDDMDLKHGEHSHTFQWLVIAMERNTYQLTNAPHDLYKSTFDVMKKGNQNVAVPSFKPEGEYSLWSYIVDCFPTSMGGQGADAGDSLFSNTYRSPQKVTEYLLDRAPQDNFLGAYLRNRYKKRSWFTDAQTVSYATISGGGTAKNVATGKHVNAPGWTTIQGNGGPVAFTRDAGKHFRADPKQLVTVKYHGKAGQISANAA